jgi:hypothetical protein
VKGAGPIAGPKILRWGHKIGPKIVEKMYINVRLSNSQILQCQITTPAKMMIISAESSFILLHAVFSRETLEINARLDLLEARR